MVGLLFVALAVGVVTGASPALGIVVAAGLVFVLVVMWDLALGVCLFVLVAFLDVVSANQNLSVTKGVGALLAASWLATMAVRRGSARSLISEVPWLTAALVAFIAWSALSLLWAGSPSQALYSTERYGLDALLIPIVFWAVRERRQVFWVFGVFVVGALLSVLWGITQAKVTGGVAAAQVGRLSGATVDANELATLLMVCTVFAVALVIVLRRASGARTLALLAAIGAAAAFFATFSRGGLVALAVVILAACVYAGRRRRAVVAVVLGMLLVGVVFLSVSGGGAAQRLTTDTSSGRTDIWTVGLRMVRAHPIVGVGSGNYAVAEPHYLLTSPGLIKYTDFIIKTPYPAHNIYLQVLVEMGVIGLALFLAVIVLSIHAAVKAVRMFGASGDRSLEILGRALVIAIVGMLAADFFVSDNYSKQLWLLLALGPALLALARRAPVTLLKVPRRQIPTATFAGPLPIRPR